jgi:hypothetical protein
VITITWIECFETKPIAVERILVVPARAQEMVVSADFIDTFIFIATDCIYGRLSAGPLYLHHILIRNIA